MRGFPRRVREMDVGRGGEEERRERGRGGTAAGRPAGAGLDGLHRVAVQTVFERGTSVGRFEGRAWADGGVVRGVVDVDVGVKKRRNSTPADFCQTFDLTKEEDETALSNADVSYATFRNDSIDDDDPWTRCFEFVRAFVRSLKQCEMGRPCHRSSRRRRTPMSGTRASSSARALKALMVDANAVCVMILPLVDAPPHASALIRHLVDCARRRSSRLEGPAAKSSRFTRAAHVRRTHRRSKASVSRRRRVAAHAHGPRVRVTDAA